MKFMFLEKWDENTEINWWNECRKKQNKIIDIFNEWQLNGFVEKDAMYVYASIEHGRQTHGSRDGGSGYLKELDKMKKFVMENSNIKGEIR